MIETFLEWNEGMVLVKGQEKEREKDEEGCIEKVKEKRNVWTHGARQQERKQENDKEEYEQEKGVQPWE